MKNTTENNNYTYSESGDYVRIDSIEQIKEMQTSEDSGIELFVMLNFGARSSKDVRVYDNGCISIYHHIDDTDSLYESKKEFIEGESFFIEAMNKKAVWAYV